MPRRPRQHQLEDRSRTEFRRLLPDHFVVRDKDKDYGVDLEVELFGDDGRATGLVFNVQIKATDDPSKRDRLRLTTSQRNYLLSLPARTILVRWCSADQSFHWEWLERTSEPEQGAESQTVQFAEENQWTDASASQIEETLQDWRRIKEHPPGAPVHVRIDLDECPGAQRQPCQAIVRSLVGETRALILGTASDGLALTIKITADVVRLSLGSVAYLEADISGLMPDLRDLIRYMITAALCRVPLPQHADALARRCLAVGVPSPSPELAVWAVRALTSSARQSVELAIANGFHEDGLSPILLWHHLDSAPFDAEDREAARQTFLEACLAADGLADRPSAQGAVRYSLGNHFASQRDPRRAIREFNQARKLRPAYADTDYFLSEVGGALFGCQRYSLGADFYRRALDLSPSPRLNLCLGDCLLFSGALSEALRCFDAAGQNGDAKITAEANLKSYVCQWLIDRHGERVIRQRSIVSDRFPGPRSEVDNREILSALDPMDGISHWNTGVSLATEEDYAEALPHFLYCAFEKSGDTEAWMNALLCALNLGRPEVLQDLLRGALALGGPTAADDFVERLGSVEEVSGGLSRAISEINAEFDADQSAPGIYRVLGNDDEA
ncbi:MAG: DUF4365 domain-containing protein [Pseudomonadota bacterium]